MSGLKSKLAFEFAWLAVCLALLATNIYMACEYGFSDKKSWAGMAGSLILVVFAMERVRKLRNEAGKARE